MSKQTLHALSEKRQLSDDCNSDIFNDFKHETLKACFVLKGIISSSQLVDTFYDVS